MKDMIKITGVDLKKFAQRVYDFSRPQGLGFLHFKANALSDEDAQALIDRESARAGVALSMDYVHGRSCKMTVFSEKGELYVRPQWYDHTFVQYKKLLAEFGIELPEEASSPAGWGVNA